MPIDLRSKSSDRAKKKRKLTAKNVVSGHTWWWLPVGPELDAVVEEVMNGFPDPEEFDDAETTGCCGWTPLPEGAFPGSQLSSPMLLGRPPSAAIPVCREVEG